MRENKDKMTRASIGYALLSVVVIALALGSCTKESLLPDEQADRGYMDFSLELTPPGAFAPIDTRAMTPDQQNAINRADVLVFKDNILLYHKTGTITDTGGGKKRVQVNLKTSQSESEMFDIMVIGNRPSGFNLASYVTKTKDELKAAFTVSATGKWLGSEFVMYGEVLQTLIKPTTNNFKIQMLRSLARVDIGVGVYDEATDSWAGLADNFSLIEVRVVNSRDKFAVIPSATTFNATGNVKVSAPTIPASATVQGTTAATAIKYSGADITSVDGRGRYTKSSIFLAEAPNNDGPKVTLLIGGSYKGGATTFYRVDLCVPQAGVPGSYDYLNILRNHLYRISITSVSGQGFSNAQEALISAPINITTELIPIVEGGMGDVVFDGNNYILTDVSQVQVYGIPDGLKPYFIATVKANFPTGVIATVTGPGVVLQYLSNGVSQRISATIPAGTTTGNYTIKVGKLTKNIPLTVQPPVDAHFDFLPFANVASITVENSQPWLTLSQNSIYVKSEQQQTYITGSANGKACFHFDENIATSGAPRTAQALVVRNDSRGTTRVYFEQRNLSGMVFGYFGGTMAADGYTRQLAIESVEEFEQRVYDDVLEGTTKPGIYWGFPNIKTGVNDLESGRANTITLASQWANSAIAPPYSIYNNYAARYCYDKNRDKSGNGLIDDDEIVWYLPARNQLEGVWIAHNSMEVPLAAKTYWSSTDAPSSLNYHSSVGFNGGFVQDVNNNGGYTVRVRCVRDI